MGEGERGKREKGEERETVTDRQKESERDELNWYLLNELREKGEKTKHQHFSKVKRSDLFQMGQPGSCDAQLSRRRLDLA